MSINGRRIYKTIHRECQRERRHCHAHWAPICPENMCAKNKVAASRMVRRPLSGSEKYFRGLLGHPNIYRIAFWDSRGIIQIAKKKPDEKYFFIMEKSSIEFSKKIKLLF